MSQRHGSEAEPPTSCRCSLPRAIMNVRPYGDTKDDGVVQLSFTLPLEWSEAADEAARRLVAQMGFTDVAVAEGREIARGFSFFVVYARTKVSVEVDNIAAAIPRERPLAMEEVDGLFASASGARSVSPEHASAPTRTRSGSMRS